MRKSIKTTRKDVREYAASLDDFDAGWLETFVRATSGVDKEALANLAPPESFPTLWHEVVGDDHARRRDLMSYGLRAQNMPDDVNDFVPDAFDADGKRYSRAPSYSKADYQPQHCDEEVLMTSVLVNAELERLNWAPYGECQKDLAVGQFVQVCIPNHLYQDCWGVIIDERRGEYLVEIRSRLAPKGRGSAYNPEPVHGRLYAKPEALRRPPMQLAKGA